jgi:hypothetical protein
MSVLNYSIARQWLEGSVGNEKFSVQAWSGGGRGRTGPGAENTPASYDVFQKESDEGSKHIHGGPIPPGIYVCFHVPHHHKFGECVFLQQTILSLVSVQTRKDGPQIRFYNRDGFFIHGRGKHGSDGCIVPDNPAIRSKLNRAIKNAGNGTVILKVA